MLSPINSEFSQKSCNTQNNEPILFCNDPYIWNIVKLITPIAATIITVLLAFTFVSFFGGIIITPITWIITAGASLTILFFSCHDICPKEVIEYFLPLEENIDDHRIDTEKKEKSAADNTIQTIFNKVKQTGLDFFSTIRASAKTNKQKSKDVTRHNNQNPKAFNWIY